MDMDQHAFETYLDRHPKLSGTQAGGRFIKNAFGVEEKVVLPESYWRYLDWLADEDGVNTARYIVDCDKDRGDTTLSENLMYWLYHDMNEREEFGHPLPEWLRFL